MPNSARYRIEICFYWMTLIWMVGGSFLNEDADLEVAPAPSATRPQMGLRELRVDERFVQIQHQRLAAAELGGLRWDHRVVLRHRQLPKATRARQFVKLLVREC